MTATGETTTAGNAGIEVPDGYAPHTAQSLPAYLAGIPDVVARLGGFSSDWTVEEVGDGNLNLVFIVRGPTGGLAVKQALPYVRLVGESWPLPLSRAHYEHMALDIQARHAPGLVPEIVHYDAGLALIAMDYLHPHIIMRKGMIDTIEYPGFADAISTFMAKTLFFTSDLAMSAADKKAMIGAFSGNTALCKITEDLIFTEPYRVAENNRWTEPYLDDVAAEFRDDDDLKVAISRLKMKFMGSAEALLHGDLHTGSMMVTPEDTKVIDPEFAFVGPMGFDAGAVIANLLLNYFSQDGHEKTVGDRAAYREWVLAAIEAVWTEFERKFLGLWRDHSSGDGYPASLFETPSGRIRLEVERRAYMDRLFQDTLGFCAAKMIRRILGLAHNIDLEWIEDPRRRAGCELRALRMARMLMVNTSDFRSVTAVTAAARTFRDRVDVP